MRNSNRKIVFLITKGGIEIVDTRLIDNTEWYYKTKKERGVVRMSVFRFQANIMESDMTSDEIIKVLEKIRKKQPLVKWLVENLKKANKEK